MFDVPETRFTLMGDWDTSPEPADRLVLRMCPATLDRETGFSNYGMFAASTLACLQALDQHVQPGMTVADVGGGTGLLAAAALALGAQVTIYESNPLALADCQTNAAAAELRGSFPEEWDKTQYDVVVCSMNLSAQVDPILAKLKRAAHLLLYTYDSNEVTRYGHTP